MVPHLRDLNRREINNIKYDSYYEHMDALFIEKNVKPILPKSREMIRHEIVLAGQHC